MTTLKFTLTSGKFPSLIKPVALKATLVGPGGSTVEMQVALPASTLTFDVVQAGDYTVHVQALDVNNNPVGPAITGTGTVAEQLVDIPTIVTQLP